MRGMNAVAARTNRGTILYRAFCQKTILMCAAAGFLLLLHAGCSCSSKDDFRRASAEQLAEVRKRLAERQAQDAAKAAKAQAKAEAEKKKKEEEYREQLAESRRKREAQQREWQAKAKEQKQAEAQPPQFPEDPADWTKDDFFLARAEGEPRLVDAVDHLGRTFPTSEPAAATLIALLQPSATGNKAATEALIEAIVFALGRNETQQATEALHNLVNGKLESEFASIARSRALHILADRDAGRFDDFLLTALRTADDDQRLPAATRAAYDWEADLLQLIDDRAGPALRVRTARYAIEPGTSVRQRKKLLDVLMKPAPANLSAQVVLLADPTTDGAMKPALAQQLAMVASCALQRLQGMPANVTPQFALASADTTRRSTSFGITSFGASSANSRAAESRNPTGIFDDPNLLRYGPAALWSDLAADLVVESLFQLERLDHAPHHLQLAATMPIHRVRNELLKALRRNWHDGPGGLRKAGIPERIVFDPALPVLLRLLPHTTPDTKDWRRKLFTSQQNVSLSDQVSVGQWHPLYRQKLLETGLEDAWAELLGETTWTLCSRLQAAGEANIALHGSQAAVEAASRYAPVVLHDDARVVAFHSASLPGSLAESSSDSFIIAPTTVTYVRMVDNVPFRKTFMHYVRQLSDPTVFVNVRTGWIGGLETSETEGAVRSVDVFITRTANHILAGSDANERLVIQVVCVECPAPGRDETEGSAPSPVPPKNGSQPASAKLTEN